MVQHATRTVPIIVASVVAAALIAVAFVASGPIPFLGSFKIADAATSAELLKAYATKDADQDGLPDWQEALYGTDPADPESVRSGVKDGDAVAQGLVSPKVQGATPVSSDAALATVAAPAPKSLTEQFSQKLFSQYLLTRGTTPPSNDEILSFVQSGLADLEAERNRDAFSIGDVKSSGKTGPGSLAAYAAEVDQAFAANHIELDEHELDYFSDAINKDDAKAIATLKAISDVYARQSQAVMRISPPSELRYQHLALANALGHMSAVLADLSSASDDPIRAMLGLGIYEEHALALSKSFSDMHAVFAAEGVTLSPGQPGYEFVRAAADSASVSQAQ
jgi:hypothetical protein